MFLNLERVVYLWVQQTFLLSLCVWRTKCKARQGKMCSMNCGVSTHVCHSSAKVVDMMLKFGVALLLSFCLSEEL